VTTFLNVVSWIALGVGAVVVIAFLLRRDG
jgi:hypothetical protein